MGFLPEILAALFFVGSSGLLFSERFRKNRVLVLCAAALALTSTYYLTVQIAHDGTGFLQAGGQTFRDCDNVCPEMIVVPAGEFTMGSPPSEASPLRDDTPQHSVRIERFAVGRFDITRAEWAAFVQATNRAEPTNCGTLSGEVGSWRNPGFVQDDNHPVVCVNWDDAQDYVSWLSQRTGHTYRLLSEAEWEYAARGGRSGFPYWWGVTASHEYANYGADVCCAAAASGRDQWAYTSPVGSFPSNSFGLYDMLGNVEQWVEDCSNDNYNGAPTTGEAWTTGDCSGRVLRGGSWLVDPSRIRSASRSILLSTYRANTFGLRVARTL
jgi:formylglycine-generating enzyme required for sulfatase activity